MGLGAPGAAQERPPSRLSRLGAWLLVSSRHRGPVRECRLPLPDAPPSYI